MEDYWILLIVLLLVGWIAIPIVILIKLSAVQRSVNSLNNRIKEMMAKTGETPAVEKEEKPLVERPILPPPVPHVVIDEIERVSAAAPPPPKAFKENAAPPRKETAVREAPPAKRAEKRPVKAKNAEKSVIEKFLTENLLSKIGIVTLILGVGFFVKYAIDRDWINETGRVGIGILVGGALIWIAHRLRKTYNLFSSILVGGGIAVLYITITLAFREYQLFPQSMAFIFLILITLLSVILALYYDRKELIIFSLLGGFASPLLVSTGTGNYIVLFSYILILNMGMLLISYRKKWRVVELLSWLLTTAFLWSWLYHSFDRQYAGAAAFTMAFFIQFCLVAIFSHIKTDRRISPVQVVQILLNNLSSFLAFLMIWKDYPHDIKGVITIGFAVINAVMMVVILRMARFHKNLLYLIIGVVLSFVSLAVPMQLNGQAITMFWAAEMVLLLWIYQKSGMNIFRLGFAVIALLSLISYVMDMHTHYSMVSAVALPVVVNRVFITGVVVAAGFILSRLLLCKEDPDSVITFRNRTLCSMRIVQRSVTAIILILTFLVPFAELFYQMEMYFGHSFRQIALATYITIHAAVLSFIYYRKLTSRSGMFTVFMVVALWYALFYSYVSVTMRTDTYLYDLYPSAYFAFHLLSLPAMAWIVYGLARVVKNAKAWSYELACWLLVLVTVTVLSTETGHAVVMLWGNASNYHSLLHDVHTFGYPILWGILAMILMMWGLKRKEVLLRKISLIFFGAIILKFYVYDVWRMSQSGRIVSFVILGVILLLVSFMQQKIKTLVKNEKTDENNENEGK